ncbi:rhomboid protein 1 [Pyrus ussuriensis x Pyrus communis]|uniref:Rhomboid protein 1 n=1 Tax=Pyrus ussuriensis x Pyrus communis TaxID=2448454 RepID=A0A5N5HLJ7_9ROSA|nr:rhomboid protein 1 [Pyrus ussuriensis x Pyrus communis]
MQLLACKSLSFTLATMIEVGKELQHHPHPWRSQHILAQKIHGFLSNPSLRKQSFLGFSNTLLRASSKSLSDCRVGFLRAQFPKRSFNSWRSWFGRLSNNEVVLGLIVANVAVFLLWRIADRSFMMNNFTISLHNFAKFFGPEFLLKLYLAGAVGGSVFFLVHKAFLAASSQGRKPWNTEAAKIPGLGASGAVNAIMLLDIFLLPKATFYLEFIIPVPAILLGIFLIGNDVLRIIEGRCLATHTQRLSPSLTSYYSKLLCISSLHHVGNIYIKKNIYIYLGGSAPPKAKEKKI